MKALFKQLLALNVTDLENLLKSLQVKSQNGKKGLEKGLPRKVKSFLKNLNKQFQKLSQSHTGGEELNEALLEALPIDAYLKLEEVWSRVILLLEIEYICGGITIESGYELGQLCQALKFITNSKSEQNHLIRDTNVIANLDGLIQLPKFNSHDANGLGIILDITKECKKYQRDYYEVVAKKTKEINQAIDKSNNNPANTSDLSPKKIIEKINQNDQEVIKNSTDSVRFAAKKYAAFGEVKKALSVFSEEKKELDHDVKADEGKLPIPSVSISTRVKNGRAKLMQSEIKAILETEKDTKGNFIQYALKRLDDFTNGFLARTPLARFFKQKSSATVYKDMNKKIDDHHKNETEISMSSVRSFNKTTTASVN